MHLLLALSVLVQIDASADRHRIDPRIYGLNWASEEQLRDLNVQLNRAGGNATTRYNWQLKANNHAADWYFESLENEPIEPFIEASQRAGAEPMITIPLIGWVAKLGPLGERRCSFSIAKYGPQQENDWQWFPDCGNGVRPDGSLITGNDPTDANMQVDPSFFRPWVRELAQQGIRYFLLDNEPGLWHETHRDVNPTGARMEEMRARMIAYATMIREEAPHAIILGTEEWGWLGYLMSGYDKQWAEANGNWQSTPDRLQHGGMDYSPWILRETDGHLDVFSLHMYPQGGEFSDDVSPAMQLRRNRSTRALWDPSYRDETWINDTVKLIPRMKEWARPYGLAIGITEYSWGAEGHMNGATAQADILGILGREDVDLAARWVTPPIGSPAYNAIRMYRNYDGARSGFGEWSIRATVPEPDEVAAFAAIRLSDGALTVMLINKTTGPRDVTVVVDHFRQRGPAQRWQLANNVIERTADVNALSMTLPSQSVTLLVVPGAKRRRSVR